MTQHISELHCCFLLFTVCCSVLCFISYFFFVFVLYTNPDFIVLEFQSVGCSTRINHSYRGAWLTWVGARIAFWFVYTVNRWRYTAMASYIRCHQFLGHGNQYFLWGFVFAILGRFTSVENRCEEFEIRKKITDDLKKALLTFALIFTQLKICFFFMQNYYNKALIRFRLIVLNILKCDLFIKTFIKNVSKLKFRLMIKIWIYHIFTFDLIDITRN